MGCHTGIFGLHNRDDNMKLRDMITEKRKEFWKEADTTQMGEELERIIDHIDGMGDRINKLESEVVNLDLRMDSVKFAIRVVPMKVSEN